METLALPASLAATDSAADAGAGPAGAAGSAAAAAVVSGALWESTATGRAVFESCLPTNDGEALYSRWGRGYCM